MMEISCFWMTASIGSSARDTQTASSRKTTVVGATVLGVSGATTTTPPTVVLIWFIGSWRTRRCYPRRYDPTVRTFDQRSFLPRTTPLTDAMCYGGTMSTAVLQPLRRFTLVL
eukprot:PhF_6_TR30438/c0_g1_i1/m.44684